tara:strand:+ start:382 stop:573 length:192 start_codon:yes stop_codon:yes gene_type:complete
MGNSEDIIYQAYNEGIRDELFVEANRLTALGGKYKHMEMGDKFQIAYDNIIDNKKKKENGKSK